MPFNHQKYENWFLQATHTLKSANNDKVSQDFDWACFKAHQGTEMGLKAFLHGLGLPAFGHSVFRLGKAIKKSISSMEFEAKCLTKLDRLYISTRNPDAFPDGAPFTFFDIDDAEQAIICSQKILKRISEYIRKIQEEDE